MTLNNDFSGTFFRFYERHFRENSQAKKKKKKGETTPAVSLNSVSRGHTDVTAPMDRDTARENVNRTTRHRDDAEP